MGFGVAVSLLIDATVVRLVLLPAVLALLGERTWYLPRWLEWLPHLEVEGTCPLRQRLEPGRARLTVERARRQIRGRLGRVEAAGCDVVRRRRVEERREELDVPAADPSSHWPPP